MQYGLFLKGIGLSVDEALLFWRTAFSAIPDDKFQKEYAYNIRHNYGLEGKRVSYSPYQYSIASLLPCQQTNSPLFIVAKRSSRVARRSRGHHHGCPFRHFSSENLETRLYKDRISPPHVAEIMNYVRGHHYQIACTRHFEVTHADYAGKVPPVTHPNEYFQKTESWRGGRGWQGG